MKRFLSCLTAVGLAGTLMSFAAAAQDVGFVDMDRVLQESKPGKDAQAKLEERFADKQQEFAERERDIRRMQAELERDKPLMSEAQLDKKEAEIKELIGAFEEDFSDIQRELAKAQQEEGKKILEPAREAVNSVAKQKKLGAVFEASQAGLMYLGESADITDDVIEAMSK